MAAPRSITRFVLGAKSCSLLVAPRNRFEPLTMDNSLIARARALADAAHDLRMEHHELKARSDMLRRQRSAGTSQLSALKRTAGLLQQLAAAQHIVAAGAPQIIHLGEIVAELERLGEHDLVATARDLLATFEETQVANVADRDRLQDELRRVGES